jgi:hypothetical protein
MMIGEELGTENGKRLGIVACPCGKWRKEGIERCDCGNAMFWPIHEGDNMEGLLGQSLGLIDRKEICAVGEGWEKITMTTYSGAVETVRPPTMVSSVIIQDTTASKRGLKYFAAT